MQLVDEYTPNTRSNEYELVKLVKTRTQLDRSRTSTYSLVLNSSPSFRKSQETAAAGVPESTLEQPKPWMARPAYLDEGQDSLTQCAHLEGSA